MKQKPENRKYNTSVSPDKPRNKETKKERKKTHSLRNPNNIPPFHRPRECRGLYRRRGVKGLGVQGAEEGWVEGRGDFYIDIDFGLRGVEGGGGVGCGEGGGGGVG